LNDELIIYLGYSILILLFIFAFYNILIQRIENQKLLLMHQKALQLMHAIAVDIGKFWEIKIPPGTQLVIECLDGLEIGRRGYNLTSSFFEKEKLLSVSLPIKLKECNNGIGKVVVRSE